MTKSALDFFGMCEGGRMARAKPSLSNNAPPFNLNQERKKLPDKTHFFFGKNQRKYFLSRNLGNFISNNNQKPFHFTWSIEIEK